MRPVGRFIVAMVFLLPALDGCDGAAGRAGSSGFDISDETAAIRAALDSGQCVDFESLKYCAAEERASANTPMAGPRVNTNLATATSIDCVQAVPDGSCTYVVRFVAQGFAPGTTFQALSRVDAADNPWVLGPDPRVGGSDPLSFSTTLTLTATDGGPPAQVQFAILAFSGAPPSSTEVGQLHQADATYAFMTQDLVVNVIPPPTASPTPTSTPTPTATLIATSTPTTGPNDCCQCESSCVAAVDNTCGACTVVFGATCDSEGLCTKSTPTPGPNDCCQCESSCAAVVDDTCGACSVVFDAACDDGGLCSEPTPTPTATTPTPCVDCPLVPFVYVSKFDGDTVSVIDTNSNRVTATIPAGGGPVAASPTKPFVYVGFGDAVAVLNTVTNTVVSTIAVRQPAAIALTTDGAFAYVSDTGLNSVSIVDLGVPGTIASLPVGSQPAAIAATPDGAFVYVVNTCGAGDCFPISRGTVSIIDTQDRSVANTLTLGYRPNGIAMSPDGRFAYVANQCGEHPGCTEGTLSVIDLGTQAVVDNIHITGQFDSQFVAITPDSQFAYVTNTCGGVAPGDCSETDGSVSVVDLLANSVIGPPIQVGGQPLGIAITPDGRTAYVAAQSANSVVAIDTATNVVEATIPVGSRPVSLAIAVVPAPATPTPTATPTPQPTASSGVVGTGTADTCTYAALTEALARGGLVTFNCGGPATIDVNDTRTETIATDTTVDGGGMITIDGGSIDFQLQVAAGVAVTVKNLTVIGDNGPSTTRAFIVNDGALSVTNSTLSGGLGSAIHNRAGGTMTVTDSMFSGNTSGNLSSGIINEGTLTVTNSTFSGYRIGAIDNRGALSVTGSTFSDNFSAIINDGTLATVTGSTFTLNSSTCLRGIRCFGGGIDNRSTLTASSCTFSGSPISNGGTATVTDSTFSDNGGNAIAILNEGTLSVSDSTFSSNYGAIDNRAALSVTASTFSANSLAISNSGTFATVTGSIFSGNSTNSDPPGRAILNEGALSVSNSTFSGHNGAIVNGGTLSVSNSTVSGNNGGALSNSGTLTVSGSTFAHNNAAAECIQYRPGPSRGMPNPPLITSCTGGWGGAISNVGTLSVANSTFADNSASRACLKDLCSGGQGGAIYNAGPAGALTVLNSTFFGNSASNNGAAIANTTPCAQNSTAPCSATLVNTIVAHSVSGGDCTGPITDGGHNLDDGASCGFSTANGSLSNTDPQLDAAGLQDNGGSTQTIGLQAGSPAINAGDNAICATGPVWNVDQRGLVRPGTEASSCSVGAYEFDPPGSGPPTPTNTPTVTPTATPTATNTPAPNGHSCSSGTECASSFCFEGVCCDPGGPIDTATSCAAVSSLVDKFAADAKSGNPFLNILITSTVP